MQVVPDRKVVTIGPIIYSYVEIGSTVWTDEHATYLAFFKDNPDFHHETVNHKKNFVNPYTGAHAQNIENLWSQFKKFKRQKSYTKIEYLELYIAEFTVRKRFERSIRWMFFEILLNLCFE
ncbi:hypothetical protein ENBRE01_2992 [Enteropsectra breve]|nr:hypothetical protein ENBRE01_2992 [Enteropsectra breve]